MVVSGENWQYLSNYKYIPDDDAHLARFMFAAIATYDGNDTTGNLLDAVSFGPDPVLDHETAAIKITKKVEGMTLNEVIPKGSYEFVVSDTDGNELATTKLPTHDATIKDSAAWSTTIPIRVKAGSDSTTCTVYEKRPDSTLIDGRYSYVDTSISVTQGEGTTDGEVGTITARKESLSEIQFVNRYVEGNTSGTIENVGNRIRYAIYYDIEAEEHLCATVPLNVCMYGYRSTGKVVTPNPSAYQIRNYSFGKESNYVIKEILQYSDYVKILDEKNRGKKLVGISLNKEKDSYTWYYYKPTVLPDNYFDLTTSENVQKYGTIDASGTFYAFYSEDTGWDIKKNSELESGVLVEKIPQITSPSLEKDYVILSATGEEIVNFGKTPAVGDVKVFEKGRIVGKAIQVDNVSAKSATWILKPMNTLSSDLARGEIKMSISSAVSGVSVDLAEQNGNHPKWKIPSPEAVTNIIETPAALPLEGSASIAGKNANDIGCFPVLSVTYTVSLSQEGG